LRHGVPVYKYVSIIEKRRRKYVPIIEKRRRIHSCIDYFDLS
jgi:hypothetical protein